MTGYDPESSPLLSPLKDDARKSVERSLLWKLDSRMSILVLIYILNYIDRNNAAAARLRGFEEDLHLTGSQFANILSILYVGYLLMQIPSNMLLNYFGKPSLYLPGCMAIWGMMSCFTGTASTYYGALWTRFFIGFFESAFYPGCLFLISKWYKQDELSQRVAYLSSGSLIASGTGALIASGLLSIVNDALGIASWRWLFYLEGSLTILVAGCSAFILPDFPETSFGWLTPAERALAMQRMQEENRSNISSETNRFKTQLDGFYAAVSDPKVWWLAGCLTSLVVSLSFNAYFPTIARDSKIGNNVTTTLLLCAPPWFVATAIAIIISRHSDKTGERCWHITISLCIGIVGFVLARSTMNATIRYISLFMMSQSYAGHICLLAWASGSLSQSPAKRAVALALVNTVSSLGNVIGAYIWPISWAPDYSSSFSISIFANALTIVMCWAFRRHLASLNRSAATKEALNSEPKGYRYLL
ncbi:hypothetical protein D9757_000067 [Collybiopsis confluens]|uniref:Major facilitator superfamily (MFS) profile domain-containing protein n=1 Tax=Collybiopsis confluens TaxID=2823264 RepID=A0A8H5I1Q0_9AGAR|nr:hypothetical protein D9757_000067 [Collybiopsis confluens]